MDEQPGRAGQEGPTAVARAYGEPPWCPYCDIVLALRWTEGSFETSFSRYARCQQCQSLFLLTTDGWDDIDDFHRYGFYDVDPQEEPAWPR